ncbi:MAG: type II secretion system F family protein [Candidatus Hecatellaceae archaeon]
MLMMRITKREKEAAWTVSLTLGAAIIGFAALFWPGLENHPYFDYFFVVGVMLSIFPPAFLDIVDRRWRNAINKNIVYLVRNVAEAQRTGMTFVKAIEESSKAEYGPLSRELRRAVAQMSWGVTYEEALRRMADRINTPLVYRVVEALIEVGRSGGRVGELLEALATHIRDLEDLARERSRQMLPYIGIIYASFFVYIFVVIILFQTVFVQLAEALTAGFLAVRGLDLTSYYVWFFHMSILEAAISGLVAGKMGEGAVSAGLKHILLLLAVTLVIFIFVIKIS